MSESEILEPERVGSDTKTQRGTRELRFSADVPSSNEVRDSKPNKINSLPKWMKTVPTLQQWCILLAVVHMVSLSHIMTTSLRSIMHSTALRFSVFCSEEYDFLELLLFLLGLLRFEGTRCTQVRVYILP